MPLFSVTIEYEVVVEATDRHDAERRASAELYQITSDEEPGITVSEVRKIKMSDGEERWLLPPDYTMNALPWGGDGVKTIGEILEEEP